MALSFARSRDALGALLVAVVCLTLGCSDDPPTPPPAPALPTSFGPFPDGGQREYYFTGGRDLAPGLYRTSPVPGRLCVVSSPNLPYAGVITSGPGSVRQVGPDGYPLGAIVPRHPGEFVVRDQYLVEVSGPCTWRQAE